MRKGSMTVFMGMSIMLILSIFFSLLEVVHYRALKKEAVIVTKIGIESMFADYNRPMWEDFGILAMDAGYCNSEMDLNKVTDRIRSYLESNLTLEDTLFGGNHLVMDTTKCELSGYTLITDDDGKYFIKQCADAGLADIPENTLDSLRDSAEQIEEDESSDVDIDAMLDDGQNAIAGTEDESGTQDEGDDSGVETGLRPEDVKGGLSESEIESAGNPIESISEFKTSGILAQVMPDGMEVSEKEFNADRLSQRKTKKGTIAQDISVGVDDQLLFEYYLLNKFGCCGDSKGHSGIDYELEYIISGKDDDKSNLESVVTRILALRSAANLGSLMADGAKLAQAESLAISLGGISANPVVVELIKVGIIAAWVYVESILDVRTLLSGGKIVIVKTPADWTSTLPTLGACLSGAYKAKESETGISYKGYLGGMLLLISKKDCSFRAMDLIENELHTMEDYKQVKMDNMIVYAELEGGYEAYPVFGSFVTVGTPLDNLKFECIEKFGYAS